MLIEMSEEEREALTYFLGVSSFKMNSTSRARSLWAFRDRLMNLKPAQPFSESEINELDRLLADAINETAEGITRTCCAAEAELWRRMSLLQQARTKLSRLGPSKKVCFADVEHQFAEMHRGAFHYPGFGEIQKERRFRKNVETKLKKLKQGLKELADAI